MSRKYSGKFYNKREKEVMKKFNLIPSPQSGAGWVIKEDGYNDNVMAQLKSTSVNSYKVSLTDIDKLEYHAEIEHKIPVFIIDFIERDEQYILVNSIYFNELLKVYKKDSDKVIETSNNFIPQESKKVRKKIISSSEKGKDKVYKEIEKDKELKEQKWQLKIKKIKEERKSK